MTKALARDPAQRFASAAAMQAALTVAAPGTTQPGSRASDATVIGPSPAAVISPHLVEIERKLATYVGPIASYLVRSASGRTTSFEELCQSLSISIDKPDARAAFLRDALRPASTGAGPSRTIAVTQIGQPLPTLGGAVAIPQADLDRAQADLARHIGPIATLLMRRERAAASSAEDLWTRLAAHIDKPADREAFLRARTPR